MSRRQLFALAWSFGITASLLIGTAAAQDRPALIGRVVDETGSALPHADVQILQNGAVVADLNADFSGAFARASLAPGEYILQADAPGFATTTRSVRVSAGETVRTELTLGLAGVSEQVEVIPSSIVGPRAELDRIPGSLEFVSRAELEASRVFTTNEALRKVSGLHARDEEGFGLRPNIGIRGTNPTRSTRVLLLEDGIPLAYAPYGDNASYYHPPVERFDSIEVLKGSGQIAYGPMTVGGVVNYLTPLPPSRPTLKAAGTLGNREYANGHVGYGATAGPVGLLFDYMRKQGDGSRDNLHFALNDVNGKGVVTIRPGQLLTLRGNYYSEDSNITYSGLRQDEYAANPRQNPFANDFFYIDRFGGSATYTWAVRDHVLTTTNLYLSEFHRDWWRQSSNSAQRPSDSSDPQCGGMANLSTTCGNEGRLRDYTTWGVEPRVHLNYSIGSGLRAETDLGVRAHFEEQERRQENGQTPTARTGILVENNRRVNDAYSGFLQQRLYVGSFTLTPGVRVEKISYERANRLAAAGQGVTGTTDLTQVIPGIGISHTPAAALTWFAGLHRGFAPPRTEDIINNNTGGVIDLDPELSWNVEAGVRTTPATGVRVDATYFRLDYENQIIPASVAGGLGATLTNAGETRHQGLELSARVSTSPLLRSEHDVRFNVAYTAVPEAEFVGTRFSSIPGFQTTSVSGNRLPYAPEHMLTASIAYLHPSGLMAMLESVAVSEQFGDDLNTRAGTPDGQRGLIPSSTLWNTTANYRLTPHATVFLAVKNLFDRTVIVDRTRGLLPGIPRLVQAGVSVVF
jgi:Fe(3+) dicitrate transport protein